MRGMPRPAPFAMSRPAFGRHPLVLVLALLLATALAAPGASAAIFPGDPVVAPSPALRTLDGIDLAPDGTGALVFTMQDGGVDHVFASRLVNGAWSAPERVDGGLAGPSAQPAVAAGDGGRVVVAFANGGNVYAATRASAASGWVQQAVWGAGGASSPSVDLSVNGKGYLAFTAPGAGGHDVRVAFSRDAGPWALAGAPLDGDPAADAGAGAGRPHVGASADGVAIVVWGEGGHVLARRVRGSDPSVVFADASADVALEGVPASASDSPVVAVQDDDSFTAVAFRADFPVGAATRSRVVYRRLRGSRFEPPTAVDPFSLGSAEGSASPRLATVGTGNGIALASGDATFHPYALLLRSDVAPSTLEQIDTLAQSSAATYAVPAAATARKMLVAWQLTPAGGTPEIHARYFADTAFEAEQVISQPQYGATRAAAGIAAGADDSGDIAVAYVQDVPGQGPAIAVATVDQPPGRFAVKRIKGFLRTHRPTLAWTTSRELWGRYFRVSIDGADVAVTGRRAYRTPALPDGAHTWQVTALDSRGQSYVAPAAFVRLDTTAPTVTARVSGRRRAGTTLRLAITALDAPPPPPAGTPPGTPPVATSGVRSIVVDWGDRTPPLQVRAGARHAYARPGRYTVRVVVTDAVGNRTSVRVRLKLAKPSKRRGSAHRSAR